ncbi:MAG: polysaccharide deacetylase [Firmicutes bacterium]|nr:polysaccharide deacetylase [Bacillota bacterium]
MRKRRILADSLVGLALAFAVLAAPAPIPAPAAPTPQPGPPPAAPQPTSPARPADQSTPPPPPLPSPAQPAAAAPPENMLVTVTFQGVPVPLRTTPELHDSAVVVNIVELLGPLGLTARWCQWAGGIEIRELADPPASLTPPEARLQVNAGGPPGATVSGDSQPRYAVLFDKRPYALVGGDLVECQPACAADGDSFRAPLGLVCAAFKIGYKWEPSTRNVALSLAVEVQPSAPASAAQATEFPAAKRYGGARPAYLTIDDGPNPGVTPQMLDVLKEYGVKATFFVVGWRADAFPGIVKRIAAEGHALGNHTYTHRYSEVYSSPEAYVSSLEATSRALRRIAGTKGTASRPPGGSSGRLNPEFRRAIEEAGYSTHDWNVTAGDTSVPAPTAVEIAQTVRNQLEARSRLASPAVILMHDGRGHEATAEALPAIIRAVASMGYEFDVIREEPPPAPAPLTTPAREPPAPPALPPAQPPSQPLAPPAAPPPAPAPPEVRCPSASLLI